MKFEMDFFCEYDKRHIAQDDKSEFRYFFSFLHENVCYVYSLEWSQPGSSSDYN